MDRRGGPGVIKAPAAGDVGFFRATSVGAPAPRTVTPS
jgi:hypothetical protein